MAEGTKSFWISIGAGAVLIVAVAPFAYSYWKTETAERATIRNELAELDAKIAKSNAALTQLQRSASVDDIAKGLGELNARIKSTSEALAAMQKATLDSVAGKLEQLNANVKSANDALAGIQKATSLDAVIKQLGQLDTKVTGARDAIKSANDVLTDIQKASMTTGSTPPAKSAELESAIGDLGKRIDDDNAARGKLADEIARLQTALQAQGAAKQKAEPPVDRGDVVVFYVQSPDAMQKAQSASPLPPLVVRFEKIGGLDDNGQTDMIVEKLKAITKDRSECTVTVAGYADTLGGDKINLAISKKRAHTVATKLQTAFAGGHVRISEAAWGERRLQDWTPNNVAHEANRRVDVSVSCKPE